MSGSASGSFVEKLFYLLLFGGVATATVTADILRFVLINLVGGGSAMCHVIIYCVLQIKCQNTLNI